MVSALTTPVVVIIFNRPERTAGVFATIRAARPPQLFVIADGPRSIVKSDSSKCAAARAIIEQVDWPCQIFHRFAEQNVGLRRNVSEGLDWVFSQVKQAIILEDDCLPDSSFFPFCETLLQRYAEDPDVGMIGGTNFDAVHAAPAGEESYYFSNFCHIWGWATWRRAWQLCDHEIREWPLLRRTNWLMKKFANRTAENFWRRHFDDSYAQRRDGLNTWDVAWQFACWRHDLLTIVPRNNLVSNVGFAGDSAHTKANTRAAQLPTSPIKIPLRHPKEKKLNAAADKHVQENFCAGITRWQGLYWKLRLPLPIWLVRRVMRWFGR